MEAVRSQNESSHLIILDNAGTDGTSELFQGTRESYPEFETVIQGGDFTYLRLHENTGGAGGFYHAMKYAVEQGFSHLWIMDDDAVPHQDALREYVLTDKHLNSYGFLTGKVLWKDGSICVLNVPKRTKWERIRDFSLPQLVQYASFVSLFIRSETVMKYGLPYKEFFLWGDDWEYTRRISKERPCFYVPGSVTTHYCAINDGCYIDRLPDNMTERFRYLYRNDVVIYRQDGMEGYLYLALRNVKHISNVLFHSKGRKKKLKLMADATKEGIRFKPTITYPVSAIHESRESNI